MKGITSYALVQCLLVDCGDTSRGGRVHVADCLDGLDLCDHIPLLNFISDLS